MGIKLSSEAVYFSVALGLYDLSLNQACLFPDIGLDESLLKYSGTNSTAELQSYSDGLLDTVPGYVNSLGSALGAFTSVPNAVGLGALVISMIIEMCIKSSSEPQEKTYSMLQRVFGEEKASDVRDTMSEYLKRHRIFINNEQSLGVELQRLEAQLSNHLTTLKNSLQQDGQMSTRGFKIWINGVSFHVQMMIHQARLSNHTIKPAAQSENEIQAAIDLYLLDLDNMLQKYKTFMINSRFAKYFIISAFNNNKIDCSMANNDTIEVPCKKVEPDEYDPCGDVGLMEAYMDLLFTRYEPISGLKSHFLDIKRSLTSLISQRDSFTLNHTTLQ